MYMGTRTYTQTKMLLKIIFISRSQTCHVLSDGPLSTVPQHSLTAPLASSAAEPHSSLSGRLSSPF